MNKEYQEIYFRKSWFFSEISENFSLQKFPAIRYITKQLEYVTKDHIAMHTILFTLKTALFFSVLVV